MNQFRRAAALVPVLAALGAPANLSAPATAATPIVSPLPGTPTAMPQTQISFLGASASSLHAIAVTGSKSGRHTGRLRSYAATTGASFIPTHPFTPGESVTVSARWTAGRTARTLRTNFTVAVPVPGLTQAFPVTPGTAADLQSFHSEPSLHPPTVQINQGASPQSAPGYIFAAPFQGPGQWGPMILDNAGHIVWFRPVPAGQDAANFRTQTYGGHTDLTWWQGHTVILGYGLGANIIADSHYRTVAVVRAGNGMATDEHEFTILPNGAAIVIAYQPVRWNLASAGGPAQGQAVDTAVQEVDIRTGLVMWEWRSLGHVEVNQSYSKPPTTAGGYYDYFHLNSAELLPGGKLLISARNTSALYELSIAGGRILWQLGGKTSTFTLGPGVAFADQHNAMVLPGGDISLFDDEGAPPVNPPSRGEIVRLDMQAKSATLVKQLVHAPGLATGSQGNVQQLAGGKYMVGWGGLPDFTEFDAEGNQLFDGTFPKGEFSYRVYRLPWSGRPLTAPALAVRRSPSPTAYASWNGATGIATWKLLAGSSARSLHTVATVASAGFETAIPAPAAKLYQVRALSGSGRTLASSRVTTASG